MDTKTDDKKTDDKKTEGVKAEPPAGTPRPWIMRAPILVQQGEDRHG